MREGQSSDMLLIFADLETNECLENNGGCWQDKAANITACRVSFGHFFFFFLNGISIATMTDYSYFNMNRHCRILLGEDCASALLFKVLNLLVTVTLTAKVNYFLYV